MISFLVLLRLIKRETKERTSRRGEWKEEGKCKRKAREQASNGRELREQSRAKKNEKR